MIGTRFGDYEIQEELGQGAMGAVYRALDVGLDREVAVKVLRAELAADAGVVERFKAEAKTAAKILHPNVATVYSFGFHAERYVLAMELVPGRTLDGLLREDGRMDPARALPLFRQLLAGVGHAHRLGIVHRDIKPANMLVTPRDVVKLTDFGIARVLGASRMTRDGRIIGTIEYMSPERIKDLATDPRSDIYSLGIVLYEMLAGKLPFEGQSDFDLMHSQVHAVPPPLKDLGVDVPSFLQDAIQKCVEKAPEGRFQSIAELDEALDAEIASAAPPETVRAPAQKATRVANAAEIARLEPARGPAPHGGSPPAPMPDPLSAAPHGAGKPVWRIVPASITVALVTVAAAWVGLRYYASMEQAAAIQTAPVSVTEVVEEAAPHPPETEPEPAPARAPEPPSHARSAPVRVAPPKPSPATSVSGADRFQPPSTIMETPSPGSPDRQGGTIRAKLLIPPSGPPVQPEPAPQPKPKPPAQPAPLPEPGITRQPQPKPPGSPPPAPEGPRSGEMYWKGSLKKKQQVTIYAGREITASSASSGRLMGTPFPPAPADVTVVCPSPAVEIKQQPDQTRPLIIEALKKFSSATINCTWIVK